MLYVLFSFDMFCSLFLLLDPIHPIQHGLKFGANVFYYLKFMILEDKSPVYFRIANVSSFLTNLANFLGKSINWWISFKTISQKKIISVFYLWNLLTSSNPYNKFELPVFPKFVLNIAPNFIKLKQIKNQFWLEDHMWESGTQSSLKSGGRCETKYFSVRTASTCSFLV